ncbi:MAG: Na+/H+ antiporter NhaA [Mediterranea sp.]|jgi:NhaA family Na+:H+ antiporter|nr:Na+/H+ antiporter NhaA [Mediterranea sp.]
MAFLRRRYLPFINISASVLLFVTAVAAAILANSPLAPYYHQLLATEVCLRIGDFNLFAHDGQAMTVFQLINDGFMTVFFLAVGLEIKRELLVGELSSFRKAILPFIAACGGMIVPVIIYAMVCPQGSPEGRGLAIPMATDIAFSLGVLSLLGKRVPLCLKVFLTAFAVVDDIGGILVIAIFYSSHVSVSYLLWAALVFVVLYLLGIRQTISKSIFVIGGVITWYLFLQSGIHSTIAGVILAFVIPARPRLDVGKYIERIRRIIKTFPVMPSERAGGIVLTNRQIAKLKRVESASDRVISILQSLEDNLHNTVSFVVLPLFAFANAGVTLGGGSGEVFGSVTAGVMLGLVLGKFIGLFSFTWMSIKTRLAPMPLGMNWRNLAGVSLLGGIGFTVSLFISNLSFGETAPALLNQAKAGVLGGSLLAGILGFALLSNVLPRTVTYRNKAKSPQVTT